jgi:hypothetical protein
VRLTFPLVEPVLARKSKSLARNHKTLFLDTPKSAKGFTGRLARRSCGSRQFMRTDNGGPTETDAEASRQHGTQTERDQLSVSDDLQKKLMQGQS